MMRITGLSLTAIVIASALFGNPLRAVDWKARKLKVDKSEELEGGRQYRLQDGQGHILVIRGAEKEMTEEVIDTIVKIKDDFYSWRGIRLREIDFEITPGRLSIAAIPESCSCKGQDLMAHLPAALLFSRTDSLEYGFRIEANQMLVRVAGEYKSESELCSRLLAAISNPSDYLMQSRVVELEKKIAALSEENLRLRLALMRLQGAGKDFARPGSPERKAIERALELKKKNPRLNKEELLQRLEGEGLKLNREQLDLFFRIFNQEPP